jgi:hypothetical protein
MKFNRRHQFALMTLSAIFFFAYSTSHYVTSTGGHTSAPGDGTCTQCHSGANPNINGSVTIEGLPATIESGDTYTLSIKITNPDGNAAEAGFQLLALTGTNTNAGSMTAMAGDPTVVKVAGGKNYFGHEPAPPFPASNELEYSFNWTAPASPGSNPIIKFYAVSVLANGNNGTGGDRTVFYNVNVPITGTAVPLTLNISNPVNPTCFNSANGRATAVAGGGTGSYTYLWSNGATTATVTNLTGGDHNVTVTSGSDQITGDVSLTAPDEIIVAPSSTAACAGQNTGSASANADGGTGNLTYQWSNGATTPTINNVGASTYTVTVRDANNCSKTSSVTVQSSPAITVSGSVTNAECNGQNSGSITVNPSGGTAPFSYLWSNGSNNQTVDNLLAGSYTITVTDNAGCTKTNTFNVTQPTVINTTSTVNNVTCNGGSNGSATLSVSGGTSGYTVQWSNGTTTSGNMSTANNLAAGAYTATVTDANNCQKVVSVTVTAPPALAINATAQQNPSCFGSTNGSISVNTANGSGNVTYIWSNGTTGNSINNVAAGNYTVTATDANNCNNVKVITLSQPQAVLLAATPTSESCSGANNGQILIAPSGGTGNFTYNWSNNTTSNPAINLSAGSYTVTVTDAQGCTATSSSTVAAGQELMVTLVSTTPTSCLGASNGSISVSGANGTAPYTYTWSNGASGDSITNVTSGQITVTVTDIVGCTKASSFNIGSQTAFSLTQAGQTDVICFGQSTGTASITPLTNHTYLWSNGATTSSVTGLVADTISVVATDPSGCQSNPSIFIITQSPQLKLGGLMPDTAICASEQFGAIRIDTLVGGIGAITYAWTSQDTMLTLDSLSIDSLNVGWYNITLKDDAQCVQDYMFTVFKVNPVTVTQQVIQQITCQNDNDGAIEIVLAGGYKNTFQSVWNTGATSLNITNLAGGIYTLNVTDSIGCVTKFDYTIVNPTAVSAIVNKTNESTAGANNGTITAAPSGGIAPYTLLWSNGSTENTLINLAPSTYGLTVTDANGCTFTTSTTILAGTTSSTSEITAAQILLYPNPSNGLIEIATKDIFLENDQIKISDTYGNSKSFEVISTSEDKLKLDIRDLAPGMYIMTIGIGTEKVNKRIVILGQ